MFYTKAQYKKKKPLSQVEIKIDFEENIKAEQEQEKREKS